MKEHYTLTTVSKKELVNAFDLTESEAGLVHKYRRKLPAIIDADGDDGFSIDMRELHGQLKVKAHFKDWSKRRLKGMTDGKNFCSFLSESTGGRKGNEYRLTVDAAKMVAMQEGGEVGGVVREYFVLCEKLLFRMAKRNPVRQNCKESTAGIFDNIASRVPHGKRAKVMAEVHAMICTVATGQRPSVWKKMIGVDNVRDFLKLNASSKELKRYDEVASMAEMLSRDVTQTKSTIHKQLKQSFGESDIYCNYLAKIGVSDFDS